MEERHVLSGSERAPVEAHVVGPPDKPEITVSVVLTDEGAKSYGPLDDFADDHNLRIDDADELGDRIVKVTGSYEDLQDAFGVKLDLVEHPELGLFRRRSGPVSVPADLAHTVHAVLGLDDRPVARMHLRAIEPHAGGDGSLTPVEIARMYGFPSGDGAGRTVGIIELGGGLNQNDLKAYWSTMGIASGPTVTAVGVDGGRSSSDGPNGADGEVMLDIEVVGAVVPGAAIRCYFAPNSDNGFIDAVAQASQECDVISISWGQAEEGWTAASRSAFDKVFADAQKRGVPVTAASGDSGSDDGMGDGKAHVDYPAASPYVLGCGGTRLTTSDETVWNDDPTSSAGGGGVSRYYPVPDYQANAKVPGQSDTEKNGRGVPDVSGNADPNTGYQVRVDGRMYVIGGTSAVAPLWAGLLALVGAKGNVHALLYEAGMLKDISEGNNGAYSAVPGEWDACTGLGSPIGSQVLKVLGGGGSPAPDPPPPTPTPDPPAPGGSGANGPFQVGPVSDHVAATLARKAGDAGMSVEDLITYHVAHGAGDWRKPHP